MRFEFDPAKSAANLAKHGIDFEAARAIWDDPNRLEVDARNEGEPRVFVIGRIQQTTWAALVTYRHEETIRLISVRRARRKERAHYEQWAADDPR
jgi:hypothetical protein